MALGAYAQGAITGNSFFAGSTALVFTNGASVGQGTGPTSTGGDLYEFVIFTAPPTISGAQNNPLNGLWTFTGAYGTNNTLVTQNGGMSLPVSTVNGWAAGASNAFFLVVWSTSLGFDWGTISNEISSGVFNVSGPNPYGWLGYSAVGWLMSGGFMNPAVPIFGTPNPDGQPINTQTILLPVGTVPEPTTFTLFGLGAAGLLIFRRRKN